MFFSPVFAQATSAAPQQPGMLESFLPFVLIIAVFWFLILRPQNKKMKAHREMVNNVSRGDTVVTAGGLIAKVTKVKDDNEICLLYTSDAADDLLCVDLGGRRIIKKKKKK
eukprot:TRINITY_DN2504_c0_g1_i1.p1 TRINITY_DN2504_c0_g1~~TRINITY_DN2504_c0_g1_i1.p1  ORF type:complete len:111 (-),score=51.96 TRINITY_DN2504_c0_g1_i1:104-436(-)